MRALLLLLLLCSPASARRAPTVGGDVRVALPEKVADSARAAALGEPLLDVPRSDDPAWLLRQGAMLSGTDLRSARVHALESDDPRAWTVVGEGLTPTLTACLSEGAGWPAKALRAAGVSVSVSGRSGSTLLRFDRPVGALPELLTGCLTPGPSSFLLEDGDLVRSGGAGVSRVVLVAADQPADVSPDATAGPERSLVVSDLESVVILLQGPEARSSDALGVGTGCGGLAAFRQRLRPALMAQVLLEGRGQGTDSLLPPAVAPPGAPCPVGPAGDAEGRTSAPFALAPPEPGLLAGLAERLAALAQARGASLSADPDARLLRWEPLSRDPALSLLALGAQHPELRTPGLSNPALLDADPQRRLEAALDLQSTWLDERRVVPLLIAKRWLTVDGDLRGVRVRADGVPLLHDAWWRLP